jgi:hypothetical protein
MEFNYTIFSAAPEGCLELVSKSFSSSDSSLLPKMPRMAPSGYVETAVRKFEEKAMRSLNIDA